MTDRKFRIPVVWQMAGWLEVSADDLEDALSQAETHDGNLPEGTYIDGSYEVNHSMVEDLKEVDTMQGVPVGMVNEVFSVDGYYEDEPGEKCEYNDMLF